MNALLDQMLAHADPSQVAGLSRFFKTGPGQYGEGDKFLGIKVPVTREVVKDCWRDMIPADWQERAASGKPSFPELEACVSSEYHEIRLAALLTLVEIFKHAKKVAVIPGLTGNLRQQCIDFYLSHTQYINNWDLVDLSCYPLLGEWLLDKDRSLLYDLARNGRTLWEQRIGIVSTMTFIRHGQLDDTFAIADILLHHPHDLIHKAVGWLLREASKRDKAALKAYLKRPACGQAKAASAASGGRCESPCNSRPERRGSGQRPVYTTMPRTMLRYAIERFPEAERRQYLTK